MGGPGSLSPGAPAPYLDELREPVAGAAEAEGKHGEDAGLPEQAEAEESSVRQADVAMLKAALEVEGDHRVVELDDISKNRVRQVSKESLADVLVERPKVDYESTFSRRRLRDHADEGDNVGSGEYLSDGADCRKFEHRLAKPRLVEPTPVAVARGEIARDIAPVSYKWDLVSAFDDT